MGMVSLTSFLRSHSRGVEPGISLSSLRATYSRHSQDEASQPDKSGETDSKRAPSVRHRSCTKGICHATVGLLRGSNPFLQRGQTIRTTIQNYGPIYLSHRERKKYNRNRTSKAK